MEAFNASMSFIKIKLHTRQTITVGHIGHYLTG